MAGVRRKARKRKVVETTEEAVKRVSPMKGKKVGKRKKSDPKLGRAFSYGSETEKHVITLSLPKGAMATFLKKMKTESKAKAVTALIGEKIKLPKKVKLGDRSKDAK